MRAPLRLAQLPTQLTAPAVQHGLHGKAAARWCTAPPGAGPWDFWGRAARPQGGARMAGQLRGAHGRPAGGRAGNSVCVLCRGRAGAVCEDAQGGREGQGALPQAGRAGPQDAERSGRAVQGACWPLTLNPTQTLNRARWATGCRATWMRCSRRALAPHALPQTLRRILHHAGWLCRSGMCWAGICTPRSQNVRP